MGALAELKYTQNIAPNKMKWSPTIIHTVINPFVVVGTITGRTVCNVEVANWSNNLRLEQYLFAASTVKMHCRAGVADCVSATVSVKIETYTGFQLEDNSIEVLLVTAAESSQTYLTPESTECS